MTRPATAFDSPQFGLVPDTEVRMYGNVSNDLVIEGEDYSERENPVVIPTSLFLMMKDIMKVDPTAPAFLYLAKDADLYVLGVAWSDVDFCDLWTYTDKTLPHFLQTAVVQ
jgi:hypothetical protein